MLVAFLLVVIVAAFGSLAYGLSDRLPALVLTLFVAVHSGSARWGWR